MTDMMIAPCIGMFERLRGGVREIAPPSVPVKTRSVVASRAARRSFVCQMCQMVKTCHSSLGGATGCLFESGQRQESSVGHVEADFGNDLEIWWHLVVVVK